MTTVRIFDPAIGDRAIQLPIPATGMTPPGGAPANQPVLFGLVNTVSSDPSASQDSTQGYTVGSVVFNNTAGQLRIWSCRDATATAAKWVFEGADYASGGTNPNIEITQFGGAPSAQMAEEGNINRQVSSAGVQPGSTGVDNVIAVYSLPAGALDAAGRGLNILAAGSVASNTNTKTLKIIWGATTAVLGSAVTGGTTIASLTTGTTAGAGGWQMEANVFKYGANGSNTQLAIHASSQSGNLVSPLVSPTLLTATESGAILIAVTANVNPTTDATFNFLDVNAMN